MVYVSNNKFYNKVYDRLKFHKCFVDFVLQRRMLSSHLLCSLIAWILQLLYLMHS